MSKAALIYFISSIVVIVGLIMTVIIVAQAGRIRNFELNERAKDSRQEIRSLQVRVKMRDTYLQKIKNHSNFKNGIGKIKQVITEWEILQDAEKAPLLEPTGADLSVDMGS